MEAFLTNYGIVIAEILVVVAAAAAILFPIVRLVQNPKNAKGALIGIVALVVVVGISYALSDEQHLSKIDISPEGARRAETGIFAFYILIATAIVGLIYSAVAKFFK